MRTRRALLRRPAALLAPLAAAAALAAGLPACGGCADEPDESGHPGAQPAARAPAPEDVLRRERAAGLYAEEEYRRALAELEPLVEREDAAVVDLVSAAAIALEPTVRDVDLARRLADRAAERALDDPRVRWALYRVALQDYRWSDAVEHLRAVRRHRPDDRAVTLALGAVLEDRAEEEDRLDEAAPEIAELYRSIRALGPDVAGSWYLTATYRLAQLLRAVGEDEEVEALLAEWTRLQDQGLTNPTNDDLERGELGRVVPPASETAYPAAADVLAAALPEPAGFRRSDATAEPLPLAGYDAVRPLVPDAPPREPSAVGLASLGYTFPADRPREALLAWGPAGLAVARRGEGGWVLEELLDAPVRAAAALDLGVVRSEGGDGDLDLVAATAEGLVLLEREDGAWTRVEEPLADAKGLRALVPVDHDHDGDLDLLGVGDEGAVLLRNDAAHLPDGGFADASAEAGLPAGPLAWAVVEDLDRDNDVDLLVGGPDGVAHLSNLRGGRFEPAPVAPPAALAGARAPLVGDLDGDGWPDLASPDGGRVWLGGPSGAWRAADAELGALLDPPRGADHRLLAAAEGAVVLDADADGAPERVLPGPDGWTWAPLSGGPGVALALEGDKDNARGVGAIVEVVLGPLYRRVYWRGEPVVVATHGRETVDVVRVTWPNGVVQNVVELPAPGAYVVRQRAGLVGSCPFLYAWDGTRYVFVSDVLGITPLGLPMAPGVLVPPDHDEYVLVRGAQLAPRDGWYELQLTEELREVTYLDRVRLDVVDHPAGVEVQPNERFTFPPFPEPHVHAIEDALAPRSAVDGDGVDWTDALAAEDCVLAEPFEPLRGQYLGLAPPWHVELAFDPERVRDAERLRLVMTGWFYWTDASVNVAVARDPGLAFVPPVLQVPDPEGGWRDAGPPVGFPAGKLKTMVIDVTDVLVRDDPRLRVATTLRLYWDAIRLAVDAGDAPLRVTEVEPASAWLWERGFSAEVAFGPYEELAWFDWDLLAEEPRWNQHPGLYTRLGECVELVGAVDDRFVVMGAGDALRLRFPADAVPPLPAGWQRDFLLFLDGWAKDRDPNTLEALHVEPYPFHGMSGYPYGTGEAFPDGPEHRAWRRDWQTRPARAWIPPLAPGTR